MVDPSSFCDRQSVRESDCTGRIQGCQASVWVGTLRRAAIVAVHGGMGVQQSTKGQACFRPHPLAPRVAAPWASPRCEESSPQLAVRRGGWSLGGVGGLRPPTPLEYLSPPPRGRCSLGGGVFFMRGGPLGGATGGTGVGV